jgi:hypothetical protein
LDYAKSLRVLTNIYHQTTFVSLYQASENIYNQFDKVLVIDEGRQVYFGPVKEARAYFEGLGFLEKPRQTTPDYLTGCTDRFEREYKEGRGPENAPSTPETLAEAFNKSTYAAQLDAEMAQYREVVKEEQHEFEDFKTAVIQGKRHAPKKSVYSIPYHLQVWALMQRQFILKWQDRFSLVVSWATSILIAIILGTVWLQLPQNLCWCFHQRWSPLHLSALQRFPGFRRIGFDNVRPADHQQTPSICIPSTFSIVDRSDRRRPGFRSCADFAVLYHCLLHVWSGP